MAVEAPRAPLDFKSMIRSRVVTDYIEFARRYFNLKTETIKEKSKIEQKIGFLREGGGP